MSFIIDPYRFGFSCADADATAFILAAGITDLTQKQAICTLVSDLKAYGLWTKMKAIYPFCGSTATQQKYNLKDPRDLDAAFRLVFAGGWTHSSTGALPNGVNAYGDTRLNLLTTYGTAYDNHFSVYFRTNNVIQDKLGANTAVYNQGMSAHICYFNGNTYNDNMGRNFDTNSNYGNSAAYHISSLLSTTSQRLYRNGILKISGNATTGSIYPSRTFYFGALNQGGTAAEFSNRQIAFGSIGDGLTNTEAANLYTAVQAYQTTLGRQV